MENTYRTLPNGELLVEESCCSREFETASAKKIIVEYLYRSRNM
jgi:hypothetical protein